MRATRAVVRLDHLRHNIEQIRVHTKSRPRVCLAVKADAYGHGIVEIGRAAATMGVDCLAVATVDEAVELRLDGTRLPVLLYSLPVPSEIGDIVAHGITPMVGDPELIDMIAREARLQRRRFAVHLKVDTGMGRIGCKPEETAMLARLIASNDALELGGVSTHFAAADSPDPDFTVLQTRRFEDALSAIRDAGIDPGIVHAANSGAILWHPDTWYDMIRPGLLAYGYAPGSWGRSPFEVRPVMELRSKVVFVKEIAAGETVSYGMTWRSPGRTCIGTIPVGYGDGYFRSLSNRARVLISGAQYPLVGVVCMDQMMVDLGSETRVRRYDDAILFGFTPGAPSARELAALCGTISYEITSAISRRVPRVYVTDDAQAAKA